MATKTEKKNYLWPKENPSDRFIKTNTIQTEIQITSRVCFQARRIIAPILSAFKEKKQQKKTLD